MAMTVPRRVGLIRTIAATTMICLVWIGLHALGFRRIHLTVAWLADRTCRAATTGEVLLALEAVDAAADWTPFRVACLERSLATVLLLTASRRGVTWCVGARNPPLAMHAWLCDQRGHPIGEPAEALTYQPLVVIAPPHQQREEAS